MMSVAGNPETRSWLQAQTTPCTRPRSSRCSPVPSAAVSRSKSKVSGCAECSFWETLSSWDLIPGVLCSPPITIVTTTPCFMPVLCLIKDEDMVERLFSKVLSNFLNCQVIVNAAIRLDSFLMEIYFPDKKKIYGF